MPVKKSLNKPGKQDKVKLVKLPAKNGGVTTSVNDKTGTAKYPGKNGFAVATGVSSTGLKKGTDGKGKVFSANYSSKVEDRTVFKGTKKGTKLALNKAARSQAKAKKSSSY